MAGFYITKITYPELPDFISNDQFLLCIDNFKQGSTPTFVIAKQHNETINIPFVPVFGQKEQDGK